MSSDMQLKYAIEFVFSYGDILAAVAASRVDWTAAKAVETNELVGKGVEDEDGRDVSKLVKYFNSSEVSEEWALVISSVLSDFPICFLSNIVLIYV